MIWSGAPLLKGYNLKDFRPQNVNGESMLTGIYAHSGVDIMINNQYEIQEQLHVKHINIHDFNVVQNGTRALAMTVENYRASVAESRTVGFNGQCQVSTTGFDEYDTTTWEKTFAWSAQKHITINESYTDPECMHSWDFM